ncbi:hypothetical protein FOCC_FOCC002799 [Frankliniella occidentalis]|nr:hypothetical protein FOCC_FOCC002799 [Frankliniella occidentalis]
MIWFDTLKSISDPDHAHHAQENDNSNTQRHPGAVGEPCGQDALAGGARPVQAARCCRGAWPQERLGPGLQDARVPLPGGQAGGQGGRQASVHGRVAPQLESRATFATAVQRDGAPDGAARLRGGGGTSRVRARPGANHPHPAGPSQAACPGDKTVLAPKGQDYVLMDKISARDGTPLDVIAGPQAGDPVPEGPHPVVGRLVSTAGAGARGQPTLCRLTYTVIGETPDADLDGDIPSVLADAGAALADDWDWRDNSVTDPCSPNPCLSGGTCLRGPPESKALCQCRPGTEGHAKRLMLAAAPYSLNE